MVNYRKSIAQLEAQKGLLVDELAELQANIEAAESDEQAADIKGEFEKKFSKCKSIDEDIQRYQKLINLETSMESEPAGTGEQPQLPGEAEEVQGFASFGEQLAAVAAMVTPGGAVDQRLAATGMSEGVASDGGFLVQTDFRNELIKPVFEGGQIASRIRTLPIGQAFNSLKMNAVNQTSRADGSRWGGIVAYWEGEGGEKTKSKPTFRQMELNLKKLIGLCYTTDELMQDTTALGSVIKEGFKDEFTFKIEDAVIWGTGAGTPLGIMNSACLVSVTKETGQAAKTIVAENIEKMYARLNARSIPKAVWLINQDCWPQLFQLSHVVGTGGIPVFILPGGLVDAPNGALLGRPVIPVEYSQTLGTKGDIIFGDFSQYLGIDKGGIKNDFSIHVRFLYDESVFRFVYRFDGQPTWNSALTPYKGTNTQSPFIALNERT